jgi:hypothetical protein
VNVDKLVAADHRQDWRKFAEVMFKLEDADPGYMLLKRAAMDTATKMRYVLAWCTYYNPGIAAVACQFQGAKFYEFLRHVFPSAKRASERRHFRGQAGQKALMQWQDLYPKPEAMIEATHGTSYMQVRKNMQHMAQMGDYFYWKLADIWDTVFDEVVDFTGCEKYMPKVPQQGADIIYQLDIPYPVKGGRKLALQEAETVCCVFKQHVVGDYQYGFRSAKAWKRLNGVEGKPAAALREGLLAGGIWTPETLEQVGSHI